MTALEMRTNQIVPTEKPVYACHADGLVCHSCVLDENTADDCVHAGPLLYAGKGKMDCLNWRPVAISPTAKPVIQGCVLPEDLARSTSYNTPVSKTPSV